MEGTGRQAQGQEGGEGQEWVGHTAKGVGVVFANSCTCGLRVKMYCQILYSDKKTWPETILRESRTILRLSRTIQVSRSRVDAF